MEDKEVDIVVKIHSLLGTKPNKTVDCSGTEATNRLGLIATKSGGVFVIFGCGSPEVKLPLYYEKLTFGEFFVTATIILPLWL